MSSKATCEIIHMFIVLRVVVGRLRSLTFIRSYNRRCDVKYFTNDDHRVSISMYNTRVYYEQLNE